MFNYYLPNMYSLVKITFHMRHKESETMEVAGEHIYPWYSTADKAHTQLLSLRERNRIVNWLSENGAKLKSANGDDGRPKSIEIWSISAQEPLFIHYKTDQQSNKRIIRMDSSAVTATEMIEDGIISRPIPNKGRV